MFALSGGSNDSPTNLPLIMRALKDGGERFTATRRSREQAVFEMGLSHAGWTTTQRRSLRTGRDARDQRQKAHKKPRQKALKMTTMLGEKRHPKPAATPMPGTGRSPSAWTVLRATSLSGLRMS